MAYIQYLVFNEKPLPLPDSYDIGLSDVEADSGGETEAGTTQRDVEWLTFPSLFPCPQSGSGC